MRVGLIGCGLIGEKRSRSLGTAHLAVCADVVLERAQAVAAPAKAVATDNWLRVIESSEVDVVIVSATNDLLAKITKAAVENGKHVLVEKPGAINVKELDELITLSKRQQVLVRVGFNHRYHRAIRKAHDLYESGALGDLMFVRGRYGHGGRLGYEKEWRSIPAKSGGGELIDQGVHLIELARWFLGDFNKVTGTVHTYFWDMPVEDNAFLLLETANKQTAFLHASCTEWKNTFSFEIYGKKAKVHVEGLGGSYGTERLHLYAMLPQMGPPETTIWEYPMPDNSWELEFSEFLEDIRLGRNPSVDLRNARAALEIVETVYAQHRR
jgi:predicted dehydrogenase